MQSRLIHKRVDAVASAIGHESSGFRFGDKLVIRVLGRVSDHQEWRIVFIDEIAAISRLP